MLGILDLENVHLCFSAGTKVKIMNAKSMPTLRLLVEVEATTNSDHPSGIGANLPVVDGVTEAKVQLNPTLHETIPKTRKRIFDFKLLLFVFVSRYELNLLDRSTLYSGLAEADEVLNLV